MQVRTTRPGCRVRRDHSLSPHHAGVVGPRGKAAHAKHSIGELDDRALAALLSGSRSRGRAHHRRRATSRSRQTWRGPSMPASKGALRARAALGLGFRSLQAAVSDSRDGRRAHRARSNALAARHDEERTFRLGKGQAQAAQELAVRSSAATSRGDRAQHHDQRLGRAPRPLRVTQRARETSCNWSGAWGLPRSVALLNEWIAHGR